MMGSNDKPQDELFYAFNLNEIVPKDHLLRDIDRVLDLSALREHLAPYYSHTGPFHFLEEPAWPTPRSGSVPLCL